MVFTTSKEQLSFIPKGTIVFSNIPPSIGNNFIYKIFLSDSEIDWKIDNDFDIHEGETIRDCYNFILIEK